MGSNGISDTISKAQHQLLDRLIEWEETLATLYGLYAELFPQDGEFWSRLSAEEMMHAKILKPMHEVIDDGFLLKNIGAFRDELIRKEVAQVSEAILRARNCSITQKEAAGNALQFETSVIDSQFYAVVQCDSPIFSKVAQVHTKHGGKHLREVHQHLDRLSKK